MMYLEKKYILCLMLIGQIVIGFALPRLSAGINNPAAERQATKQIMDLIGEKFGAAIGAKRDSNNFFHPLRMGERHERSMFQTSSRNAILDSVLDVLHNKFEEANQPKGRSRWDRY